MRSSDEEDDEEVLRRLIYTYAHAVRSVISKYERDPMEAEEIWADVFNLGYKRIVDLRELSDANVRSWLLRTARFLSANGTRRAITRHRLYARLLREPLPFAAASDDEFDVREEDLVAQQRSSRIREVLAGLREDQRQVLVMDSLGQTGPAIAEALDVSPAAARKRLMRARAAFRTAYNDSTATDVRPTPRPMP